MSGLMSTYPLLILAAPGGWVSRPSTGRSLGHLPLSPRSAAAGRAAEGGGEGQPHQGFHSRSFGRSVSGTSSGGRNAVIDDDDDDDWGPAPEGAMTPHLIREAPETGQNWQLPTSHFSCGPLLFAYQSSRRTWTTQR